MIYSLKKKGFDAYGLNRSAKEDEKGILETSKYRTDHFLLLKKYFYFIFIVNDLIEKEINNGIPSERVVSEERFNQFYALFFFFYFRSSVVFHSKFHLNTCLFINICMTFQRRCSCASYR